MPGVSNLFSLRAISAAAACAENFMGGEAFAYGCHLYLVCAVCDVAI